MISRFLNKKIITIMLHIGSLGIIFLLPFLQIQDSEQVYRIIARNSLPSIFIVLVFYINYFLFINTFFFKKKKILFFLLNLILITLFLFLFEYVNDIFYNLDREIHNNLSRPAPERRKTNFFHLQLLLSLVLSIGMSIALKITMRWKESELEIEKIKQSQLSSEIKSLRHQIQPHFLFNTLNNIYSLVDQSPEIAKTSIHSLSNMMRYLLHESIAQRVPLAKEITFLERYIDLMQLRVSSNLILEKNFPIINQPILIAPLLLISFIENAFKHGIDALEKSFIKIDLTIHENFINYTVTNSFFPEKSTITDSGIGLENLKKRLHLLYPDKFELTEDYDTKTYTARLILNFLQ